MPISPNIMCKFAIHIVRYIKAPLPHYTTRHNVYAIDSTFTNAAHSVLSFIHGRWILFDSDSESVWCFFPLSLLILLFIALAMVFRCKNISSVDHIRRDSILIEFVLSHVCIHYWQGCCFFILHLILGTAIHMCGCSLISSFHCSVDLFDSQKQHSSL